MDPNNPIPSFLAHGGLSGAVATGTPTVAQARAARYVYTKAVHLWNQVRRYIISLVTATRFIPTYLSAPDAATMAGLNDHPWVLAQPAV